MYSISLVFTLCFSFFLFYFVFVSLLLLFAFVFFFKQKTAYEMRISDWSSDVCSSDLLGQAAAGLARVPQARGHGVGDLHADDVAEHLGEGLLPVRVEKIGRASCRERVCQYV